MRSTLRSTLLPAVVFALLAPTALSAQIRASERGTVSQVLDGTTLTVGWSRPAVRDRALFGELVPFGVVWTPGANWATTFEADRPVRLGGVEVPAGRYSMWMTPRADEPWTLSLDPRAELFHFQKPDSTADQIHVAFEPEVGPHAELLTWSFPAVRGDVAVLRMSWGTTAVSLPVVVPPSELPTLEAEERARFVGTWAMEIIPGSGWPPSGDLVVWEEGDMLRGRLPFPFHPGDELEFDLVPAGRDAFHAGLYRDGRLFNVETGAAFEFGRTPDGTPVARIRGIEGTVFGEGRRAGS